MQIPPGAEEDNCTHQPAGIAVLGEYEKERAELQWIKVILSDWAGTCYYFLNNEESKTTFIFKQFKNSPNEVGSELWGLWSLCTQCARWESRHCGSSSMARQVGSDAHVPVLPLLCLLPAALPWVMCCLCALERNFQFRLCWHNLTHIHRIWGTLHTSLWDERPAVN